MPSSRIPFYHVQGTHYQCACAIGGLTRDAIRQRIEEDLDCLAPLLDFINTNQGRCVYEDFIGVTRLQFPWYWDEIQGLADGSSLPLEQILLLNFFNETQALYRLSSNKPSPLESETNVKTTLVDDETGEKGCTTVLLNRRDTNTFVLLHNEDHAKTLLNTAFLIHADIQSTAYDDGQRFSPREKYLAYCYAGALPGNAFSVNHHGFAMAMNGLYPKQVGLARLPRQIFNRALLSIENQAQLDSLIQSVPVAFGFCINGCFFMENDQLFNYEVGPNLKTDDENLISKRFVVNETEVQDDEEIICHYLVHYNHYERLNHLITEQSSLASTFSRWKRGQEIGELLTIDDGISLLGDQENSSFPIFRQGNTPDVDTVTLCTAQFDFRTLTLTIYEENPKLYRQPSFVYNLIDIFN